MPSMSAPWEKGEWTGGGSAQAGNGLNSGNWSSACRVQKEGVREFDVVVMSARKGKG